MHPNSKENKIHVTIWFHRIYEIYTEQYWHGRDECCEWYLRADFIRFALSQWETALLCNDVSHWLGVSLESALYLFHQSRTYLTMNPFTVASANLDNKMIEKSYLKSRDHAHTIHPCMHCGKWNRDHNSSSHCPVAMWLWFQLIGPWEISI